MAVKWVDRVPTNPNRMKITPETGSPYYATVERADNPTVEGTPVNAANLNAMQEGAGLTVSRYVYVSTAGSDSVGNGSQANPYATINKALSTIPKNLNGYEASIYIAAGTYPEKVLIRGFVSGVIRLTGEPGAAVTISGLDVILTQFAEITNLSLTLTEAFVNTVGANLRVFPPLTVTGALYGVHAAFFSNLIFADTLTVNNSTHYSVVATNNSNIYVNRLEGSGNNVTFRALLGSTVTYGSNASTATYSEVSTESGGRVYSGAQTSTPNY